MIPLGRSVHVIPIDSTVLQQHSTEWRRCIGCLKLQISFRKRATNFRALLRRMTYKDKASYVSTLPCRSVHVICIDSTVLQQHSSVEPAWCYANMHKTCCSASACCSAGCSVAVQVAVHVAVHVTHTDFTVLQQHSSVGQIGLCMSFTDSTVLQ